MDWEARESSDGQTSSTLFLGSDAQSTNEAEVHPHAHENHKECNESSKCEASQHTPKACETAGQ